ncbi:DUF1622 domain-containing protein [candidate division WOR-3 bacterium]|nr:DUF1622 domain-containing protein [candidate division WOR-3 bacterium]
MLHCCSGCIRPGSRRSRDAGTNGCQSPGPHVRSDRPGRCRNSRLAILPGVIRLVYREFSRLRHRHVWRERERIPHQLGSYLLLGLEFFIAADFIVTIVDPALIEPAILDGIVLIPILISFLPDCEMRYWY